MFLDREVCVPRQILYYGCDKGSLRNWGLAFGSRLEHTVHPGGTIMVAGV